MTKRREEEREEKKDKEKEREIQKKHNPANSLHTAQPKPAQLFAQVHEDYSYSGACICITSHTGLSHLPQYQHGSLITTGIFGPASEQSDQIQQMEYKQQVNQSHCMLGLERTRQSCVEYAQSYGSINTYAKLMKSIGRVLTGYQRCCATLPWDIIFICMLFIDMYYVWVYNMRPVSLHKDIMII